MRKDSVITVNENDEILGYVDKMEAHRKGILHRAISVIVINSKGEWLLQQRAAHKYHSGLLWSNTTCTHPYEGETDWEASRRRLIEEMGILTILNKLFTFTYRADVTNQLVEHELDHVYLGFSDDKPSINPDEVADYRYVSTEKLVSEMKDGPEKFTPWFRLMFEEIMSRKHLIDIRKVIN